MLAVKHANGEKEGGREGEREGGGKGGREGGREGEREGGRDEGRKRGGSRDGEKEEELELEERGGRGWESPQKYSLIAFMQIDLQKMTWNKWQMLYLKTVKFQVWRIFWASLQRR